MKFKDCYIEQEVLHKDLNWPGVILEIDEIKKIVRILFWPDLKNKEEFFDYNDEKDLEHIFDMKGLDFNKNMKDFLDE